MNNKLKKQIKMAFEPPLPKGKKEFLMSLDLQGANRYDFIIRQISYIRKRVWIISCTFVILAFIGFKSGLYVNTINLIWIISAFIPFISLVSIMEIARSASYNMAELEISCKFNLSNIILARLSILGSFNIIIYGIIVVLCYKSVVLPDFKMLNLGLCLFLPLVITCLLSLFVLNRLHTREATYVCSVISCFVSLSSLLVSNYYDRIFGDKYLILWSIFLMIMLFCIASEIYKLIKDMEELKWNWSLTD